MSRVYSFFHNIEYFFFIRHVVRVPLECSIFCSPLYETTDYTYRAQFNKFCFNIFFYELQIHSIKLLPFPELSMEIKIFSKLTFKFPVNIHTYNTVQNMAQRKTSKRNIGWRGKIYIPLFKWILNRASYNRKSINFCLIKVWRC